MTSIQSAGFALIISVILLLIGTFTGIDTPPSSTFSYQLNVNGLLNTLATILPVPPWPTTGIYDSYFPPFQSLYLRTGLAGITIFFLFDVFNFYHRAPNSVVGYYLRASLLVRQYFLFLFSSTTR